MGSKNWKTRENTRNVQIKIGNLRQNLRQRMNGWGKLLGVAIDYINDCNVPIYYWPVKNL